MNPLQNVVGLDISEIEKAVGSLTCMSLRFRPVGLLKQSRSPVTSSSPPARSYTTLPTMTNGYKDVKGVMKGSPESQRIKGF